MNAKTLPLIIDLYKEVNILKKTLNSSLSDIYIEFGKLVEGGNKLNNIINHRLESDSLTDVSDAVEHVRDMIHIIPIHVQKDVLSIIPEKALLLSCLNNILLKLLSIQSQIKDQTL